MFFPIIRNLRKITRRNREGSLPSRFDELCVEMHQRLLQTKMSDKQEMDAVGMITKLAAEIADEMSIKSPLGPISMSELNAENEDMNRRLAMLSSRQRYLLKVHTEFSHKEIARMENRSDRDVLREITQAFAILLFGQQAAPQSRTEG